MKPEPLPRSKATSMRCLYLCSSFLHSSRDRTVLIYDLPTPPCWNSLPSRRLHPRRRLSSISPDLSFFFFPVHWPLIYMANFANSNNLYTCLIFSSQLHQDRDLMLIIFVFWRVSSIHLLHSRRSIFK